MKILKSSLRRKSGSSRLWIWIPAFAGMAVLSAGETVSSATMSSEWRFSQEIKVQAAGLTKVRLPLETLSGAQPSLSDLRLLDANGNEIPFLINQPAPEPARDLPLDRMVMTMEKKKTVITGVVPAAMRGTGFEAITLFTPADDFLKPISLEASQDGVHWKMLIRQGPIFKQSGDPMSSTIRFSKGNWSYLRVTLDDSETPPLRVSQVRLFAPGRPIADLQKFEPQILESASDAHHTEIRLLFPAEGLPVDSVRLEVPETTFRRQVRLSNREFSAGEFREVGVSQGSIYRITLGAQKTEELAMPVGRTVPGPLVTLTIENGDSPALTIQHIWVKIIPRDLIFDAPAGGVYSLCSGNPKAPARLYDVAALQGSLAKGPFLASAVSPQQPNPAYQPPPPGETGEDEGSDIDTDPWHFRKKISLAPSPDASSLWRIELDPPAIAHNGGRLAALRVIRNEKQLPYVVDYSGVERSMAPDIESLPGSAKNKSQWQILLPQAGLPISRLRFTVPDVLFQRTLTLYEAADESPDRENAAPLRESDSEGIINTLGSLIGLPVRTAEQVLSPTSSLPESETSEGKPRRILASVTWTRTKAEAPSSFELVLQQMPKTNRLILETDNGDNAAIHLTNPQAYYTAPRLLFRAHPNKAPLYLYYGQPDVSAPQYDLNLIAPELLSTPPQDAALGAEEALKATPWWQPPVATGSMKYVFWGVMILVVLGLLIVIARLLPEQASQSGI